MPNKIRLNDLQLVLLSHAAKNEGGSVLPLPEGASRDEERTAKELKVLLRRKLLEEVETFERARSWRSEGDLLFSLQLTDDACAALGLSDGDLRNQIEDLGAAIAPSAAPRAGSKIAAVILLLKREQGATLAEMIEATGWLPHTTRAALTGLKKRGQTIARDKRDESTCYRITASA